MYKMLISAVSGSIATLPMTAAMIYLKKKQLPFYLRYPMPPRLITINFLRKWGALQLLKKRRELTLSMASHFSFGTLAGSLFYPLMKKQGLPRPLGGMVYGTMVWAVSYLGLIPALGLMPPATKAPLKRNAWMIISHLVWGATLGTLLQGFERVRSSIPEVTGQD